MAQIKLFGYCDQLSVKPGDTLAFRVTADATDTAQAQLVRLIHGDQHPDGPGFIEREVACEANGTWAVNKQFTQVGSYLTVDDPDGRLRLDGSFTLFTFIHPTVPTWGTRQALLGRWDIERNEGYCLGITQNGFLEFWQGDGREIDYLKSELPLGDNQWYFVAVSFDAASGHVTLHQYGVGNRYNSRLGKVAPVEYDSHVRETLRFRARNGTDIPFLMAGARDFHAVRGHFVGHNYCGKLDRPGVYARVLTRDELDRIRAGELPSADGRVCYWDTTAGYSERGIGDLVVDSGPHALHARGYNRPIRAQTGWNWQGKNDCFRLAPLEYGGVDFHADALIDCNWAVTRAVRLPDALASGVYAMRLRAGDGTGLAEEYIVFFVRARTPRARIAMLMPTASYLAYANEHLSFDAQIVQAMTGQPPILSASDIELYKNKEFGLSTYDSYLDGQGVNYTSYRRPILNMRPKARMSSMGITWQFAADLSIVGWLEAKGYDYEVVTDEDLHRDGVAALAPYKVVLTGTHPEYTSERMLDGLEDFVERGGRLIYTGGNGFYWVVGFRDDEPWCMEVRKLDAAMCAWRARPGEHYLATTGERGGLWRHRGRAPQKLTGVGFISEGFEHCQPYRRMPDSWHRRADWIFKGIEGEIIGDFGLAHRGAGGIELDRYDLKLGTPPHALIVASSGGHTDNYVLVTEQLLYAYQGLTGTQDYRIRADMVYFTAPNDGAVFATGSIAFGQALPVNNFDNNVARLLANVVDQFVTDGPLPARQWVSREKQFR
jgi:N,N-dimethylformamidase